MDGLFQVPAPAIEDLSFGDGGDDPAPGCAAQVEATSRGIDRTAHEEHLVIPIARLTAQPLCPAVTPRWNCLLGGLERGRMGR